jgi:hypothetical protein
MSIEKKSVVEDALLQIKAVEEAISENAKGILASTMKEEISELVKESLGGSRKSKKSLYEQEEVPTDVEDDEIDFEDDEIDVEDGTDDDEEDLDMMATQDDNTSDVDMGMFDDNEDEIAPLDMTSASPQEVLKVFKAMGDNDGIIVKKEGSYVHLSDSETDRDYLIQTESDNRRNRNMRSKLNEKYSESSKFENLRDFDFSEFETEMPSRRGTNRDEVEYELELDDKPFNKNMGDMGDEFDNEPFNKNMGDMGDEFNDKPFNKNRDEVEYELEFDDKPSKYPMMDKSSKYSMMDKDFEEEGDNYYDDEEEDLEESFKPKGNFGKMKFKYPKTMKKGVTETSDEDEELDEDWDLEEGEDLVSYPASPEEMEEGFKPKGKVGKMSFKYPKSMKKGVTEMSDDDDDDDYNEEEDGETTEAARTMTYRRRSERGRVVAPRQVRSESVNKEMTLLREKNEEYRKALDFFRNKLNEVAVFNSNLAYSTRLFTEQSTTKPEKINILRRFDNVESLKESKNLYKTIKGELDGKNVSEVVTESIQRKVNKTPQTGSATNLIESKTYENPQFMRMKDLMTKIK